MATATKDEFIGPMPHQYATIEDCTCVDCPTCDEMFWDTPRGTGLTPICPTCHTPGTRPDDCQGCLIGLVTDDHGNECFSEFLPWKPCQGVAQTPDGSYTCFAPGNACGHHTDR